MIEGDHRVMGQEAANKRIDELVRSSDLFGLFPNHVL